MRDITDEVMSALRENGCAETPEGMFEKMEINLSKRPKCPGCGSNMDIYDSCDNVFFYVCNKCGWIAPTGMTREKALEKAMHRTGLKNRALTLEEVRAYCDVLGADAAPLWYEGRHKNSVNRWMLIAVPEFVCDSSMTVKHLLTVERFTESYGKTCRLWQYQPTKEEMEGTPWA